MTDREFNEHVRQEMVRIAGYFGAIQTEVPPESMPAKLAYNGAMKALSLCTMAANRNIDTDLIADQATLEESGYDLSALATTPPATVED